MGKNRIRYFVGDIRDFNRCLESTRGIDIIIHAAAMKHVPICEYNKKETYQTNVIGTKNLIRACLVNKVKKFLLISTDKSVYPTSYMGYTKKLAEKLVLNQNNKNTNKCKFSVIRFGNVIGSRGSVLLKFIAQIRNNKKITVTHKEMTRFFITIESAVKNILEAILMMQGGEVFIIKKLKAFKIIDLAYALKKIYKSRSKVIEIIPRDGEKLFEQMLYKNESNQIDKRGNLLFLNKNLDKIRVENSNIDIYRELNSKFAKCLNRNQIIFFLKRNRLL
jgi:FlaA1/EpsC-like NDP-sugar epimerase